MSAGNSVVFNGVEIRYNALDWEELPESIPSGKLTGRLAGTHIIFTPTDKTLKQYEMQFGVNEVRDFGFTSETDDEGNITGRTIRATVVTSDKVSAQIEHWLSTVGRASAVAKVGFTVQEKLPLTKAAPETAQQTLTPIDDAPVTANDLNAAGSGREKKKQRRGGPALVTVDQVDDPKDRERVERQIADQLQ